MSSYCWKCHVTITNVCLCGQPPNYSSVGANGAAQFPNPIPDTPALDKAIKELEHCVETGSEIGPGGLMKALAEIRALLKGLK